MFYAYCWCFVRELKLRQQAIIKDFKHVSKEIFATVISRGDDTL